MRGKLTWKVPRWSTGSLVEPLPALRARWGNGVGEVVEMMRAMAQDHRDRPSAQDIAHTLRALAERPAGADLTRLDTYSSALLLLHSWRQYKQQHLDALTPDQVAACATAALVDVPSYPGRRESDPLAVGLVRDLEALLPAGTAPTDRDALLTEALLACGFAASPANLRRLRREAGRFSSS